MTEHTKRMNGSKKVLECTKVWLEKENGIIRTIWMAMIHTALEKVQFNDDICY